MSDLGKVTLTLGGEYNSATAYEKLTMVTYQGASYISKQTTQGNAPTNTTYWQKVVDSADVAVAYCNTAAGTAAKTAAMSSYRLVTGATFRLYINTTNSASSPTLSVNGTTAKSIYVNGSAASTSNLTSGWWDVLYDGTYYQLRNTGSHATEGRTALGLGTAATKSSTTSITSGGSGLPTSGTVYSYTKQVYIGSSAPSSNQSNYLWIDTSS